MRKYRVILAIFTFFLVAGCVHLAVKADEKPDIDETSKLQNFLDEISYQGHWEYYLGTFDCSNMTALLYDFLTEKGYKCKIIFGINPSSLFVAYGWHVWLIAEKNGKKFWIEPIWKSIVSPDNFKNYTIKICLGSLKRAKRLSRIIGLSHEWDY
jgi:hypothetical protein